MYKKIAVISLLGFALFVAIAYAHPGGRSAGPQNQNRVNFVDEDGDGICDYYQSGACHGRGDGFVDEDGDGICDYYQSGACHGRGDGFVDEDGDGICDYCHSRHREGHHHGNGRGCP